MQYSNFPEANKALLPSGQRYSDGITVGVLNVYTNGESCVSLWRPTLRERLSVLIFGRVWLAVLSGATQPPVYVGAVRHYFVQPSIAQRWAQLRDGLRIRWALYRAMKKGG